MSVADWIILAFLAFSVVGAAIEGFFHEAFHLAGLVVGYLLAAWQYPAAGGLVRASLEVAMGWRDCRFPYHLFRGSDFGWFRRANRALGDEESRLEYD